MKYKSIVLKFVLNFINVEPHHYSKNNIIQECVYLTSINYSSIATNYANMSSLYCTKFQKATKMLSYAIKPVFIFEFQ